MFAFEHANLYNYVQTIEWLTKTPSILRDLQQLTCATFLAVNVYDHVPINL